MKHIEIVGYTDDELMKNSKDNFCMRFHTLYFEYLKQQREGASKGTSEYSKKKAGSEADATFLTAN